MPPTWTWMKKHYGIVWYTLAAFKNVDENQRWRIVNNF
jgi:hypothetical protein